MKKLPSVEDAVFESYAEHLYAREGILERDRDLAYTSLIAGIEGRIETLEELYAKHNLKILEIDKHRISELRLTIEEIVKPLYNKK